MDANVRIDKKSSWRTRFESFPGGPLEARKCKCCKGEGPVSGSNSSKDRQYAIWKGIGKSILNTIVFVPRTLADGRSPTLKKFNIRSGPEGVQGVLGFVAFLISLLGSISVVLGTCLASFWHRKLSLSAPESVKHLQTTADTTRPKNSSFLGLQRKLPKSLD